MYMSHSTAWWHITPAIHFTDEREGFWELLSVKCSSLRPLVTVYRPAVVQCTQCTLSTTQFNILITRSITFTLSSTPVRPLLHLAQSPPRRSNKAPQCMLSACLSLISKNRKLLKCSQKRILSTATVFFRADLDIYVIRVNLILTPALPGDKE